MKKMDGRILPMVFAMEEIRGGSYGCWAFKENCEKCPWKEGSGCYFQKHRPGNWKSQMIEQRFEKWAKNHKAPGEGMSGFEQWLSTTYDLVKADKKGIWTRKAGEVYWRCSRCGIMVSSWCHNHYCPNCGALMKGFEVKG